MFTMDSDTMDSVDVDRHPCASKQVWIVRFARREQGWGRVRRRCKSISWRKKGSRWGLREDRTRTANGKVEVLATSISGFGL